jgi:hypothetical protein
MGQYSVLQKCNDDVGTDHSLHRYASALFMWKLRSGFQSAEVGRFSDGGRGAVHRSVISRHPFDILSDSFGARLRMLFWIAATNFVFPGMD